MFVKKANGEDRMCIDFRDINNCTEDQAVKVPSVEDISRNLSGENHVFCTLDIKSAYFHIPIGEKYKHITAFYGPENDFFIYNTTPFGLKNAPSFFHMFIDKMFGKVKNVAIYFDDLCIGAKDYKSLFTKLEEVLLICKENRLAINKDKARIGKTVRFLGNLVSEKGISPDPKKLESLKKIKWISSRKELKTVLGMINHFAKFVKSLSTNLKKFHNKTSNKTKFFWNES